MQRYIYAIWEKKTCFCFVDTREYDLEQKIDLEIKMREGTTKLLAACKHSNQTLEAAKSLLTSNERMNGYMTELQRRRAMAKEDKMKLLCANDKNRAKVSVSDIRMPLIWKDTDHFKNKGDYRRFAVFCLLKIGTEIYDTQMITSVDRSMTDISFEDVAVFGRAGPEFDFRLEVYSRVLHDDLSMASTPRKLTKKISTSVSKTLGRKMAMAVKEDIENEGYPKFYLVASANLRLADAADAIRTHDLVLENLENRQAQLPLFGHFCCRLAVQPECATVEKLAGYLKVKEVARTSTRPQVDGVYWAKLQNFRLNLWKQLEGTPRKSRTPDGEPDQTIVINDKTKIKVGSQALTISNENPDKSYVVSMLTEGKDSDVKLWSAGLQETADEFKMWEPVSSIQTMEIPSPSPSRVPMYLRPRAPGTLYDETPIQETNGTLTSSTSCCPLNGHGTLSSRQRVSPSDSLRSGRSRSSSLSSSGTHSNSSSSSTNAKQTTSPQRLSIHGQPNHHLHQNGGHHLQNGHHHQMNGHLQQRSLAVDHSHPKHFANHNLHQHNLMLFRTPPAKCNKIQVPFY